MNKRFDLKAKVTDFRGTSRWVKVGTAWLIDGEQLSVQLETIPVGDWDGGLQGYPANLHRASSNPTPKE